jgi:gluconolactonase
MMSKLNTEDSLGGESIVQTDWSRRELVTGAASALALAVAGAASAQPPPSPRITRFDPAFDALIAPDARFEQIMDGLLLSEGPHWVGGANGYLLVSDVPGNAIHRWTKADGAAPFLKPSGYAGPPSPMFREAGSNGLVMTRAGLVMADSGNRGIARIDMRTKGKTMLCSRFEGKRLNSPNDLVLARDGSIYFTDPPYGLINASYRELDFSGVYRLSPDGVLTVADRSVLNPNGIGISPDSRTLYVTEQRKGWVAFDLDADGALSNKRVFIDGVQTGLGGGDGFKIDAAGNMWTSSGAGLSVFDPQGKPLGSLSVGPKRPSNCEIADDGYLYLTIGTGVWRGPVKARRLKLA